MIPEFVIWAFAGFLLFIFLIGILGSGATPEKKPEEPTGPGIEKNVIRHVITRGDEEIVISEEHTLTGVDETGQIVNMKTTKSIPLDCGHVCSNPAGYGGKCESCQATFCASSQCSWICSGCQERLCKKHKRNETGKCKSCS